MSVLPPVTILEKGKHKNLFSIIVVTCYKAPKNNILVLLEYTAYSTTVSFLDSVFLAGSIEIAALVCILMLP